MTPSMPARLPRVLAQAMALAVALAACEAPVPKAVPAHIDDFSVTPNPVAAGSDVTVHWKVSGDVEGIEIFAGGASFAHPTEAEGTVTVEKVPAGKLDLAITVDAKDGNDQHAEASVDAVTKPKIGTFTADRLAVAAGAGVTLSWQTALADKVTLTANGEPAGEKTGADAQAGGLLVKPTVKTTYVLTATGVGGSDTRSLEISVLPAPEFGKLELAPVRVLAGNQTTLSWETTHATTLTVKADGRNIFAAPADAVAQGSRAFAFDATTTLTVTIAGPGGEVSRDVDAQVIPPVRITRFSADPPDVIAGTDVVLSWDVTGVQSVQLTANGGVVDLGDLDGPTSGITVNPAQTTVYELVATGEGGTATASVTVNAYSVPLIDSFTTDRALVFRHREPATLSWVTHSGTELSIADSAGNLVDLGSQPVEAGQVAVTPSDSTSYTLTLVGPGGAVQSAPVAVEVEDPVPAVTFTAAKSQVLKGEGVGLSWTVSDHTSMTITVATQGQTPYAMDLGAYQTVPAVDGASVSDSLVTGSLDDTTTFTLSATGPGGTETKSVTVTVVKLPSFKTFTSNKLVHDEATGTDQIITTRGTSFDVTWETTDATSVQFDPPRPALDAPTFVSILGQAGTVELTRTTSDDSGTSDVTFPADFNFPFFGTSYHTAQMNMDGYVCFGGTNECTSTSTYTNQAIPSSTKPNNLIAVFWDDLLATTSTKFLMRMDGVAPNRQVTLEWNSIDMYSSVEYGAPFSMQAVLFEDGSFELRNSPRPAPTQNYGANLRFGGSASFGWEGPGGTDGTLISKDVAGSLCSFYVPGSGSTPGVCNVITRMRPGPPLGTAGTQTLLGTKDELLRMIATGPVGSAPSPTLPVHVLDPAYVSSFTASKTYVGAGEQVVLTYAAGPSTTVVTSRRISDGTNDLPGVSTLSGNLTVSPTATTTYTFEVANGAGDKDSRAVTVTVAAPRATLTADRTTLPSGEGVTFSWTSAGASSLTLKAPDGTVVAGPYYSTTDAATIAAGSKAAVLTQTGTYTLEATNGSGTTSVPLVLDVASDLRVLSFASSLAEQTTGQTTTLSWETYNAQSVSIQVEGETDPLTTTPITDAGQVRQGSFPAPVRATDTTYVLTATAKTGGTTATRRVTVHAVAPATIDTFTVSAPAVTWNDQVTVSWSTTNATSVHLYQVTATGTNPPNGPEVTSAANQTSGSASVRLVRSTAFRLVVTNRLGTSVSQLLPMVVVSVGTPTMALSVSPSAGVPNGGSLQLGWTSSQAERVSLWSADAQYAPGGFVDISGTGTELVLKSSTGTATFDSGFATIPLPSGFSPTIFGDAVTSLIATADGVIGYATATTTAYCGVSSSCSTIGTLTSSTYKGVVAAFSRDLSACFGTSTATGCTTRGRAPGKLFYEVKGVSPNRFLVVQWNDWDFYSSLNKGSLTFEAKIWESGTVELQYQTMQSASSSAFTGSGGVGVQNAAASSAINAVQRPIASGDGFRFETTALLPQVPYDYVPFDFVDISQTGTAQTLLSGSTADFAAGSAQVTFPADFAPVFFGEPMTGAVIGADGVVSLSSAGNYSCTTGCSSIGTMPSTSYKAVIAGFNADLSACAAASTTAGCTARGRAPGKVFTELRGTAPNRVFIAQWSDWDFYSSTNAGSLTFEVKVFENGDAEVQYKILDSKSAAAAHGSGANIGLQNTTASAGLTLSTGTSTNYRPVNPGDGFHFYSGNQAASGSIRTFFALPSTATRVLFRGTASNSVAPGGVTDSKAVPIIAGANDILISELMIDPGADDTNKEWIELRNRKTVAVSLAGYTLQTSSGSFTFPGGLIPAATSTSDGFLVVGMSQDPALNGGAPVQLAYGTGVEMNDTADSVVLRYGNALIDRVEYDTAAGWRVPKGQSLMGDGLVTTGVGNDSSTAWCGGRGANGAKSSPGTANGQCYGFTVVAYNPAYDLEAITPALTPVQVEGDEAVVTNLPIGFVFPHFGNTYSTIAVSTNGWLSFNAATSSASGNAALPSNSTASRLDGIYPLWDDLTYISGRTVNGVTKKSSIYTATLGTAPNRRFVIHWAGYRFYFGASSGNVADFMAVLGEDGSVEFHYKAVADATYGNGSSATIGLEAQNSTYGVQYGYNQSVLPPAGTSYPFGLRLTALP